MDMDWLRGMELYWVAGGAVLVVALIGSFRLQIVQHRRLARLDERLAHLVASMSLLTDTAEGGLRDVAAEIQRLATARPAAKRKTRSATERRVSGAARRGKSVRQIAADEQMSEGEVRLRLQLQSDRAGANREQVHHAPVR